MYQKLDRMILYREAQNSELLFGLGELQRHLDAGEQPETLLHTAAALVRQLLTLSATYTLGSNLWQGYLTLLLLSENPFSLACERKDAPIGGLSAMAREELSIFHALFAYDFQPLEQALGVQWFTQVMDFQPPTQYDPLSAGGKLRTLCATLAQTGNAEEFYAQVTTFYQTFGVGRLGLYAAFRLRTGTAELEAIRDLERVLPDDLVGYERQKNELIKNTEAFLQGKKANNVLLYGDSGTGKSSSIKAIVNQYHNRGLRMLELYKQDIERLPDLLAQLSPRNYRFIVYMDDLSFESFETEYKFLKAIMEGGMEAWPNVLIYATSNRRHMLRETWKDRSDMEYNEDIHRSETMEEKLSLFHRFGITVYYPRPNREEYVQMVLSLARRFGLTLPEDSLCAQAVQWAEQHNGFSGRTAQQFITTIG